MYFFPPRGSVGRNVLAKSCISPPPASPLLFSPLSPLSSLLLFLTSLSLQCVCVCVCSRVA